MPLRLPALTVMLLLTACEQRSDLGGEALPQVGCVSRCPGMDAGAAGLDASAVERPGQRFPDPADAATVAAFSAALDGLWHGVSSDVAGPQDELGPRFEVTFRAQAGALGGTFVVHCLDGEACDPFGSPGSGSGRGAYRIVNLAAGPAGEATGELAWVTRFDLSVSVPFWNLRRDERAFGPVVSLSLGRVGAGPREAVVRRIVLAAGPWPDAGVREAGVP